ncbi:MAG: aminopeptidase [Flavobacterium sp.]|nr:MAG: aminopeptidase [Flavobacterium sp.]
MRELLVLCLVLFVGNAFCQQTEKVDFVNVDAVIRPDFNNKSIIGKASYTFQVKKKCDSIYLDAVGIVLIRNDFNKNIQISFQNKKIWLISKFKANKTYTVSFDYEASPRKALYFIDDQIWTQGQGKYTSNWLPSLDDMNDKMIFSITYEVPLNKTVIANGKLITTSEIDDFKSWNYRMNLPMSSYLVAFTVGNFNYKTITSSSNIPIELYYNPKDSLRFEPTYRFSKQIFDFLEKEIGISYPWQNYKQVPVKDFMYAGMENTTATFFSDSFVVDSIGFTDRNYINVNAHELAHQWFGNLVTEKSSKHHWLHEGFASYYALLAEKEIFGEDYYYWKLFQSAEQLKALSDEGKGESLINPKASSLTFYEKGTWALHILKEKVGEKVFKSAVKIYLEKHQFNNVITEDFISEVETVYGKDLNEFKKDWIKQSAFKSEQAYQSLMKSPFIKEFFKISALRENPVSLKIKDFEKALVFPNDFIGQEVIYQIEGEPMTLVFPLYKKAFQSNNVFVRQAIALSLTKIPEDLKEDYESLLQDESYVTQEAALGNLWVNFPENRTKYLDEMNGVIGFQDKNIRQVWLFLALITEEYQIENKGKFITELRKYTSSKYGNKVREKALEYVNYMELWDKVSLLNLIDACQHHYWRFKKSSRVILSSLLEKKEYREQINNLRNELDENSSKFLDRMENEK